MKQKMLAMEKLQREKIQMNLEEKSMTKQYKKCLELDKVMDEDD